MRVLLAEDNAMNAEIASRLLEHRGVEVRRVANGQECLDTFLASDPFGFDAVLMDIRMPRMDGYQATAAIRRSERSDAVTIPIIAMTADAFSEDIKRCQDAGMTGHIAKPIDPERLFSVLGESFSKHP